MRSSKKQDARPFTMDWAGVAGQFEGLLSGVSSATSFLPVATPGTRDAPRLTSATVPRPFSSSSSKKKICSTLDKPGSEVHPVSHEPLRAKVSGRLSARLPAAPRQVDRHENGKAPGQEPAASEFRKPKTVTASGSSQIPQVLCDCCRETECYALLL